MGNGRLAGVLGCAGAGNCGGGDAMKLEAVLRACGVSNSRAAEFAEPLGEVMTRYDIDTVTRRKHFLGQILHESGHLRYREELASGAAYEGRESLGNTRPGDGRRFKGRGLIQLTGRRNYTKYNDSELPLHKGVDVVQFPTLVTTDIDLCCDAAGWFWQVNALNALCDSPQLTETETCKQVSGVVNRGSKHKMASHLAERLVLTQRARVALTRSV